jgi:hypothetical protein
MDKVAKLFANEFDELIEKQKREGLTIADVRRLDILSRAWRSYSSNQIKEEGEDLSGVSDEILKRMIDGKDGFK